MTRQDINELISRTALGDRNAFSALYDATSAKLFGVALRILGDKSAAEDALQETFMKIWRGASAYAVTGHSPMTWLITIARNTAIDRARARLQTEDLGQMAETLPAAGPTPEQAAVARSEAKRIQACLEELPLDRRRAVRGAYLEGRSYAELASIFGVPLNTMRTWLRRSLISLRECLQR